MPKRQFPGRGLIWAAAMIPVVVALAAIDPKDVSSAAAGLNYLGRLCGLAGMVMLLLAAALSARVPGFDRWFGGLTKLWKTHHFLGAGSLLLLMAHPLLLALAETPGSLEAAVTLLFPSIGEWQIWTGWLALVLMMAFLAPSFAFFGRPDYQHWKTLHRLAGPAVLLALLHAYQYGRTLPMNAERWLWPMLAVLAVGAVSWRFVFSRRVGRLKYTVERVISVANNLVELVLKPAGRRHLNYDAGQFVYLAAFDESLSDGYAEEHPYTLSSAPGEDVLRIAIKGLGDASRAIQTIRPGSRVTVEGPYGRFFPDDEPERQLWIAGGIGITPFLGRARHLYRQGRSLDVHLIYCAQDEERARFLDELTAIAEEVDGMQVTPHYFYRQGPLDQDFLVAEVAGPADRMAFICGPQPLNDLAKRLLSGLGLSSRNIRTEEFELL
ncbi:MAG: ferric reductase-like transmembrane domain-containing protein [Wenzhouxiangellaceae bacterium]|nr:ferric reductase-like transmembrane domain-containing protein [Wenzhouxiangellaceae bacterium]